MIDFSDSKALMQKAVDFFKSEIGSIRTGRASPALIENISCSAYGGASKLTLKELGTITTLDSQTLVIQPWDPSVLGDIRQGILAANIGLTPVVDNNIIRITVPALSSERRAEYVKILHQKMEQARISIRSIRQEQMKEIKVSFDQKTISEDEKFRAEEELQKITDQYTQSVDDLAVKKETEISSV